MSRIRRRLANEGGFTLIELLIVLQILAILLAISVPEMVGFRVRANKRAAAADVRNAINDAENYWIDPTRGNQSYKNMTLALLKATDPNIKVDTVVVSSDFSTYCLQKSVAGYRSIVIRGLRASNGGLVQENVAGNCPASAAL